MLLGEADDELAGALEGHIQLPGDLIELGVALHGALRLEAAGLVQEAGVQHAGVAAAGLGADVAFLFQHGHGQLVAGQFARDGAAHHAAANDDDVIALHGRFSFPDKKRVAFLFSFLYHTQKEYYCQ